MATGRTRNWFLTSWLTALVLAAASLVATGLARSAAALPSDDPGWGNRSVAARPFEQGSVPPAATDSTDPNWLGSDLAYPEAVTVEADVPTTGLGQVGDLPIYVGRTEAGVGPDRVRLTVLDHDLVHELYSTHLAFEIIRADGLVTSSTVRVAVDYSGLARAAGGDYAARLGLAALVNCQTSSVSEGSICRPMLLDDHNDLDAGQLFADLAVAPDPSVVDDPGPRPTTYMLSAGTAGPSGNYGATPLSASDKWQVGPSSGDFSYAYEIPMPPALAGPVPRMGLTYSSQSVDGRTASSNSQPSQVGEGWSFNLGQIERRFVPCADDGHPTWGDLCMGAAEYVITLNGIASEIVRNPTTGEWRVRDDPGWRIQLLTGAANGTNAGDYWIVTTQDGTRYWFGRGTETAGAATNGTLNVPVFGDDPGEPCHNPASLAASYCMQAWRWNLDRIEDRNGNVATVFWHKEQNNYARNGNPNLVSTYNRAGFPQVIEYSQRAGSESSPAPSKVTVGVKYRCAAQQNCPVPSPAAASSYPDVPLDLMCTSTVSCSGAGHFTPSFWSAYQVDSFQTFTWDGTVDRPVDKVGLTFTFPPTNEGTSPSLWLRYITRTGLRGTSGAVGLPAVSLGGVLLANRVDHDPANGKPATHKYRLRDILNETGAFAYVTYGQQRPCSAAALPAWDTNGTDCFPQYYKPDNGPAQTGAFRKFHVRRVDIDDQAGPTPTLIQEFNYVDAPAWHWDDSLVTPVAHQNWSSYRGHSDVEVSTHVPGGPSRMRYRTFRGMNGDKTSTGTRSVTLTDSDGNVFTDHHYLAGKTLESWSTKPTGMTTRVDQYRYWARNTAVGPTAFQVHAAQYVRQAAQITKYRDESSVVTPTFRLRHVARTFDDTYGVETRVSDYGDTAVATDDTCVAQERTPNTTAWVVDLPYQTMKYAGTCGSATVLERTDTWYDDDPWGAQPDKGNVAAVASWSAANKRHITRATFDVYGRVTSVMSPRENVGLARTTITSYRPTSGRLPDTVTTTNVLGQLTKATFGQGELSGVVDENNQTTTVTRDGLGRVTAVRRPGDAAATLTYDYYLSRSAPNTIVTGRLLTGTTYVNSLEHFDGLGRSIERHTISPHASGGRIVTTTRYDARGGVVARTQPFYNSSPLGSGPINPLLADIPAEARYEHDSEGRPTAAIQFAFGTEQWRTTTTQLGWRREIDHPVRNDVTITTDVFGRTSSIVERPWGLPATTTFAYTPDGHLDRITDAKSNVTDYDYDWLGQRVRTTDPDQGTWTYAYDDNGNQASVTDAKDETLRTLYDALDRPTETWTGLTAGTRRSLTTYDTVTAFGKGRPATTKRFDGGGAYTTTVTGYDAKGNVTGTSLAVSGEPGLDGSYAFGYTYDSAGNIRSKTFPAAGGLDAETVTSTYDTTSGAFRTLSASTAGYPESTYLADTTYTGDGNVWTRDVGSGSKWRRTYLYDDVLGRLSSVRTEQVAAGRAFEHVDYRYDAESNLIEARDMLGGQAECFHHEDGLGRLTRALTVPITCNGALDGQPGGSYPYDLRYGYDSIGNITRIEDRRALTSRGYTYAATDKPHAVLTAGATSFTYDENGATSSRTDSTGTTTYGWNPEHQMATVDAPGVVADGAFVYHTDGSRMVRRQSGVTTLYLDGMEVRSVGGGTPTGTRFYGSVAMRSTDPANSGLYWTLTDKQRSATFTVADGSGTPHIARYLPFGERRDAGDPPGDRGFLGVPTDDGGLVAAGARYYDPGLGRFLSVDPLLVPDEPQTLNGYAYAGNSPTTFTDPSGLKYGRDDGIAQANSPTEERDDVEVAEDEVKGAEERLESAKQLIVGSAKKVLAIIADELGITAGLDCITKGDMGACGETLLNIAGSLAGGAGLKLLMKYAPPWRIKAAIRLGRRIGGLIDDFVDGVRGLARYADDLKAARRKLDDATRKVVGGCNSFVLGTPVLMADGSSKPIEEVRVDDLVFAANPETGERGARPVVALIGGEGEKNLVDIAMDGHTVTATDGHPFWVGSGGWVAAETLAPGTSLEAPDGRAMAIHSVGRRSMRLRVYNLTIADLHTYYVGAGGRAVLVHNAGNGFCGRLSPNQMNRAILRGKAPRGIVRIDTPKIPHEKLHATFEDGSALNLDGTWKHGGRELTKDQAAWLESNGWTLPGAR